MSFELFIGSRYLRAKQGQTFISLITLLSVAGVAVGVMALIVVLAVMSGFEADFESRILGVESHIVLTRQAGGFDDYERVSEYLKTIRGIEATTPFVETQTMLRSSRGLYGAVVKGILPESASQVIKTLKPEVAKKLETEEAGVILGKEIALNAGLSEGHTVYLISPRGMISPVGHLPAMKRFRVVGFFEAGMYEYDGSYAYVHLKEARKLLHLEEKAITGIEIRLNDIYDADKIGKQIIAGLGTPYRTKTWMQKNQTFFSALKLEKTAMFVILTLIVLVAAFNIASSLIMMVMEKTRDIAILKAMGATDKAIRRIFVIKGMAIGFFGTTLGVVFGITLCLLLKHYKFVELPADMYYITKLPVLLHLPDVVFIAIAALLICFLATLYPADQAAKLNPIEAIRYG